MWRIEAGGEDTMTVYHMVNWFFAFSFLGYLLECVVLSYENRQLVLNRGFVHGPFCIIYGFGAVGAYYVLAPFSQEPLKLYIASMLMATVMELVTAHVMARLFGSFWWDYSHKAFNYKGMICLESSLAWGALGIVFFRFLDRFVHNLVSYVPTELERILAVGLLMFYLLDFTYSMHIQLKASDDEDEPPAIGRLKIY